jgi:hypothetical protein
MNKLLTPREWRDEVLKEFNATHPSLSNKVPFSGALTAKDFVSIYEHGTSIEVWDNGLKPASIVRTPGGWKIKLAEGKEAVITPPAPKKQPLPSFHHKPRTFDKAVWEDGATAFKVSSWNGRGP